MVTTAEKPVLADVNILLGHLPIKITIRKLANPHDHTDPKSSQPCTLWHLKGSFSLVEDTHDMS